MKKFLIIFAIFLLASCQSSGNNMGLTSTSVESVTPEIISSGATVVGDKIASDPGYMQCIESSRYSCGVDFINSYAINNSDEKICQEFQDESLRLACNDMVITETAKKTLDEDRCNALSDDKRALCIQSTITAKGVKNSDPTVCSNYVLASTDVDTLENMKDRCTIHIIDQLEPTEKTKGLCGLIINEGLRLNCENKIQEMLDIPSNQNMPISENSENTNQE